MHKVEIRLTNEGLDQPNANFEVYTETLKDNNYVELAPVRLVAGGGTPLVMFLDNNERVVVVAKSDVGTLVYDKDQNANVRVENEQERKDREAREANIAKSQADQSVRSAKAAAQTASEQADRTTDEANRSVRQAEANAAKVQAEQAKNRADASQNTATTSQPLGKPASANTGPIDSKQVKADNTTATPKTSNG